MKKLIIAILSVLLLAAFMPAIYGVNKQIRPDTTWKPYIVILRNEYGQQTSKWVKGYYNPNLHGDTVATGKVAKFDFTNDNIKSITGWNKCYLPLAGDSAGYTPPTDANTGFKMNVWGNGNWSANWGANSKPSADTGQGYTSSFPQSVDSAFWYNFQLIGVGFTFYPTMFLSGLNPNYLYKFEWISSTSGNPSDSLIYSAMWFQNVDSSLTLSAYNVALGAKNNTNITKTVEYIKPMPGGTINMELGHLAFSGATGYGVINGLIVTEYKIE